MLYIFHSHFLAYFVDSCKERNRTSTSLFWIIKWCLLTPPIILDLYLESWIWYIYMTYIYCMIMFYLSLYYDDIYIWIMYIYLFMTCGIISYLWHEKIHLIYKFPSPSPSSLPLPLPFLPFTFPFPFSPWTILELKKYRLLEYFRVLA